MPSPQNFNAQSPQFMCSLLQVLLCRDDMPSRSVSHHPTSDLYASPGLSECERRDPKLEMPLNPKP